MRSAAKNRGTGSFGSLEYMDSACDALVSARQRIQELEEMVAVLTEKIKTEEMKNSALLEVLRTVDHEARHTKKLVSRGANTEVISKKKLVSHNTCQEKVMAMEDMAVIPIKDVPCPEEHSSLQITESLVSEQSMDCGPSVNSQNQLEESFGCPRSTPCGVWLEGCKQQPGDVHIPASQDIHCGQVEELTRMVKKGNKKIMKNQSTRHVALKIMYLGSRYHGFASQPGSQVTVESELFAALERTKLLIGGRSESDYSRCGRTDKGVSAIGQLVALRLRSSHKDSVPIAELDTFSHPNEDCVAGVKIDIARNDSGQNESEGPDVDRVAAARASRSAEALVSSNTGTQEEIDYVGVLNRVLPEDIRIFGWCPVPSGFNARFSCLYREYKYFFVGGNLNISAMKLACSKFVGDHDFRNFCKMDAANVHNYVRTVTEFEILLVNDSWAGQQVWAMRVRGTAFLWHQIRCMAAVLFMVGQGHESHTIVDDLLDTTKAIRKPQYIMAPEKPLVLRACGFQGLKLHCNSKAARQLRMHLEKSLEQAVVHLALIQEALLHLPLPGVLDLDKDNRQKKLHVPLSMRPTEPSYDERRKMRVAEI